MSKIIMVLILLLSLAGAGFYYLDAKHASAVYQYCTSQSPLASVDAVKQAAQEAGFAVSQPDKETLLVQSGANVTIFWVNTCEIKLLQGRVTERTFEKR